MVLEWTGPCTIEPVPGGDPGVSYDGIHAPTPAEIRQDHRVDQARAPIAIIHSRHALRGGCGPAEHSLRDSRRTRCSRRTCIRLCNSAYISAPRHIETIDEAVTILGTKSLMQLVITGHMKQFLGMHRQRLFPHAGRHLLHSLSVRKAVREARLRNQGRKAPGRVHGRSSPRHRQGRARPVPWPAYSPFSTGTCR
jgi:hypothetical protein